jgi:hypothetical protein
MAPAHLLIAFVAGVIIAIAVYQLIKTLAGLD